MNDMSTFNSRFHYRGTLTFQTAHRIGSERALDPTVPNLPLLRSADNQPYIPGSSFKGAWRAYTEAILRSLEKDSVLACNPLNEQERCLPNKKINKIHEKFADQIDKRDKKLRKKSCLACRIFGNQVLASKVYIRDLFVTEHFGVDVRDGVAIDRDLGKVGHGPFQYEAVAPGAQFEVDIVVENGTDAELGAVLFGLEAFTRGEIRLGGFKSRGLGVCTLAHRWQDSRYVQANEMISYLFNAENVGTLSPQAVTQYSDTTWQPALLEEVGHA